VKHLVSERTGRLSVAKMKAWLKVEEGVKLSEWRTRIIRDQMIIQHPELSEALKEPENAERASEVAVSSASANQSKDGAEAGSESNETLEKKK
jgi:hypothetical protein